MIIGSNKQKDAIIQQGVHARLIQLLAQEYSDDVFKLELIAVVGSLARGDENHVRSLIAAGVIPRLLNRQCLSVGAKFTLLIFSYPYYYRLLHSSVKIWTLIYHTPRIHFIYEFGIFVFIWIRFIVRYFLLKPGFC